MGDEAKMNGGYQIALREHCRTSGIVPALAGGKSPLPDMVFKSDGNPGKGRGGAERKTAPAKGAQTFLRQHERQVPADINGVELTVWTLREAAVICDLPRLLAENDPKLGIPKFDRTEGSDWNRFKDTHLEPIVEAKKADAVRKKEGKVQAAQQQSFRDALKAAQECTARAVAVEKQRMEGTLPVAGAGPSTPDHSFGTPAAASVDEAPFEPLQAVPVAPASTAPVLAQTVAPAAAPASVSGEIDLGELEQLALTPEVPRAPVPVTLAIASNKRKMDLEAEVYKVQKHVIDLQMAHVPWTQTVIEEDSDLFEIWSALTSSPERGGDIDDMLPEDVDALGLDEGMAWRSGGGAPSEASIHERSAAESSDATPQQVRAMIEVLRASFVGNEYIEKMCASFQGLVSDIEESESDWVASYDGWDEDDGDE